MASAKKELAQTEALLKSAGFTLRYERGHFRAGYCVVHERRVIVVNRFFDPPARLQKLQEIIASLELSYTDIPEEHHELYAEIMREQQTTSAE
jgi:hypothetical protein